MSDSATFILLAAAAFTTGAIYLFKPDAKAARHSQPKFVQMNQPGSFNTTPTPPTVVSAPIVPTGYILSGKTFTGW